MSRAECQGRRADKARKTGNSTIVEKSDSRPKTGITTVVVKTRNITTVIKPKNTTMVVKTGNVTAVTKPDFRPQPYAGTFCPCLPESAPEPVGALFRAGLEAGALAEDLTHG
jgi:hypothetical protein